MSNKENVLIVIAKDLKFASTDMSRGENSVFHPHSIPHTFFAGLC